MMNNCKMISDDCGCCPEESIETKTDRLDEALNFFNLKLDNLTSLVEDIRGNGGPRGSGNHKERPTFEGLWKDLPDILHGFSSRIADVNTGILCAVFSNKDEPSGMKSVTSEKVSGDNLERVIQAYGDLETAIRGLESTVDSLEDGMGCEKCAEDTKAQRVTFKAVWNALPDSMARLSARINGIEEKVRDMFVSDCSMKN